MCFKVLNQKKLQFMFSIYNDLLDCSNENKLRVVTEKERKTFSRIMHDVFYKGTRYDEEIFAISCSMIYDICELETFNNYNIRIKQKQLYNNMKEKAKTDKNLAENFDEVFLGVNKKLFNKDTDINALTKAYDIYRQNVSNPYVFVQNKKLDRVMSYLKERQLNNARIVYSKIFNELKFETSDLNKYGVEK